jgi:hypothetical protein
MRRLLAALLLLAAHRAAAQSHDICRFRALDAENPFRRWLASQDVTCAPANTYPQFPSGLWNVFARGEGTISAAPLLVDGDAALPASWPEPEPGAIVVPLLPEKHTGVIYAPRRGSAYPVDGARVTVPADEPLWLFVLKKSEPVAVITIAPLAPGTEREVDGRNSQPPALLGWLHVPEPDRVALAKSTGVLAPTIRAGSRDADLLPSSGLLNGAFFRIRHLEFTNAEIRLEGRGWVPDRRTVKVQPGLTVAGAPLLLRTTGTLIVHWDSGDDLAALDRSLGACETDDAPPQYVIALSKCPPPRRGEPFDPKECSLMKEEIVDRVPGSLTFEDVLPGMYRAELRYGKLPPASAIGSVGPLRVDELRVFASLDTVYGSVTRGGEPLGEEVRLEFPNGTGYAPEDTEEYTAVLEPPPLPAESRITVAACDGSPRAVVITDQPMRFHTRFNVDIPANELRIHVNDTFTREPLQGASVKIEIRSTLHPANIIYSTKAIADELGNVVWKGVPIRKVSLTVSHAGYEKRVFQPFTMIKSGTHEVDAQLVPMRGMRGSILSAVPFDEASVVWFSPAGAETERAELFEDGTFVYMNSHTPDETMAIVSASHPLWVLRTPAIERRASLNLRFPDAPVVAFNVQLTAARSSSELRYIGVMIGGIRVPHPVLAQHQDLRNEHDLLRGVGPQHFRDLLATGPIDVLLGPVREEVDRRMRILDIFALEQYAKVPRQRLEPGMTDVVFTP